MKKTIVLAFFAASVLMFSSCQDTAKQETTKETTADSSKTDMTQIRADITAVENKWAAAINAKDINALMALYADDAMSMQDGAPTLTGKAAIQKQQETDFAKPAKFANISFETMDVYAQGNVVTEVGKTIYKDSTGKTLSGGKYIAVFEKRDGKYLCIREIFNTDSKEQK